MSSVETGQMSAVEPERCFPCPLPQLRLNKPRGTYYIAFMAIISFPSLGDCSEAALFCLEVFLHFFGFSFEAGLAVEDASLCFVGDLAGQGLLEESFLSFWVGVVGLVGLGLSAPT